MVFLLNIGRILMVCWAGLSLCLIFFPEFLHRPPDRIGGGIQFVIAYGIGWGLDQLLGMVRRRRAEAAGHQVDA